MNMFKPTSAKTPDEYLNMISEPRKSEMKKLHEFIKKTVPKLKPHILYGMIGYGSFHYKSKSGREGDWSIICLASQKNYISVYICAVDDKGYIAEKYKDKFSSNPQKPNLVSTGKSCIRFKRLEDINLTVLKKAILEGKKSGFQI